MVDACIEPDESCNTNMIDNISFKKVTNVGSFMESSVILLCSKPRLILHEKSNTITTMVERQAILVCIALH